MSPVTFGRSPTGYVSPCPAPLAAPRRSLPPCTVRRTTHLWHDNLGEAPHNAPGARKTTGARVVCAAEGAGCAGAPPRRGGRPGPSPPRRTHAPHPAEAAERERPPPRPHEGRNGGRRPSGSGSRELTEHVLRHASMTKLAEIGMSTLRNARSEAYHSFKYRFRSVGEAPTSTFYVSDSCTRNSGQLLFDNRNRITRVPRERCRHQAIPLDIFGSSPTCVSFA